MRKTTSLFFIATFLAPLHKTFAACEITVPETRFASLMRNYVPNGSNGRPSAGAIYHFNTEGKIKKTLFEKNPQAPQAVASTQKIVTTYVASKHGTLTQLITFTRDDLEYDLEGVRGIIPGTGRTIQVGDRVKLSDLMNTLLVQSSNGAAQAISRGVGGGDVRAFVKLMNDEASSLLEAQEYNSYFHNAHGLTDNAPRYIFGDPNQTQRSTTNNLSRLLGAMMSQADFREIMGRIGLTDAENGNLRKTGSTDAAGRTVVMRFSLPKNICGDEGVAMAFFGDGTSTQHLRLRSLTTAIHEEIFDNLGAKIGSENTFTQEFIDE